MNERHFEEPLRDLFERQGRALTGRRREMPGLAAANHTDRSKRFTGRQAFWAAAALVGVIGIGTFSLLATQYETGDTDMAPSGTGTDPLDESGWAGDPDGDVLAVTTLIEREIDNCMELAGFPQWHPSTNVSPNLPQIQEPGDGTASYEYRYSARFDYGSDDGGPDAAAALLGRGDQSAAIEYGPGQSREMSGCLGQGYRSIVPGDRLADFLYGEDLLVGLVETVRDELRDDVGALALWTDCMWSAGLDMPHPFAVGYATPSATEAQVAATDVECRVQADLEPTYQRALAAALQDLGFVPNERYNSYLQTAAQIRDRLDP